MLNFIIDSLDGLSETDAKLYKADGNKFRLQVTGLPKPEDNAGLLTALQMERTSVSKLEGDLKAWKKIGETPDLVISQIAELTKAKGEPSDTEKLLEQAQAQHEVVVTTLTGERDQAIAREYGATVNTQLTAALVKVGFTDAGLDLIPAKHSDRIKMSERGGQRVIDIMVEGGASPMVGTGEGMRATFDDFAKELADKYPDLVKSDRISGAGTAPGAGASGGQNKMSRADFDALTPHEQGKAALDPEVTIVD